MKIYRSKVEIREQKFRGRRTLTFRALEFFDCERAVFLERGNGFVVKKCFLEDRPGSLKLQKRASAVRVIVVKDWPEGDYEFKYTTDYGYVSFNRQL